MKWFNYTDYVIEREEIISVGQNGNVYKWNHKEEACCYSKTTNIALKKKKNTGSSVKSRSPSLKVLILSINRSCNANLALA